MVDSDGDRDGDDGGEVVPDVMRRFWYWRGEWWWIVCSSTGDCGDAHGDFNGNGNASSDAEGGEGCCDIAVGACDLLLMIYGRSSQW